ncbi:hypothetical protein SeLEV6574_g05500 [Synchytrium endobioticum]|uniref:Uncharacterized protein n=1 Tax=Synchytrium endobioticum TaxID=286115 RepID=A0A507CU50_9FUNG|nr:hypothetical protein SeLEV6574_g05500 [Synchytrium endobioticum]
MTSSQPAQSTRNGHYTNPTQSSTIMAVNMMHLLPPWFWPIGANVESRCIKPHIFNASALCPAIQRRHPHMRYIVFGGSGHGIVTIPQVAAAKPAAVPDAFMQPAGVQQNNRISKASRGNSTRQMSMVTMQSNTPRSARFLPPPTSKMKGVLPDERIDAPHSVHYVDSLGRISKPKPKRIIKFQTRLLNPSYKGKDDLIDWLIKLGILIPTKEHPVNYWKMFINKAAPLSLDAQTNVVYRVMERYIRLDRQNWNPYRVLNALVVARVHKKPAVALGIYKAMLGCAWLVQLPHYIGIIHALIVGGVEARYIIGILDNVVTCRVKWRIRIIERILGGIICGLASIADTLDKVSAQDIRKWVFRVYTYLVSYIDVQNHARMIPPPRYDPYETDDVQQILCVVDSVWKRVVVRDPVVYTTLLDTMLTLPDLGETDVLRVLRMGFSTMHCWRDVWDQKCIDSLLCKVSDLNTGILENTKKNIKAATSHESLMREIRKRWLTRRFPDTVAGHRALSVSGASFLDLAIRVLQLRKAEIAGSQSNRTQRPHTRYSSFNKLNKVTRESRLGGAYWKNFQYFRTRLEHCPRDKYRIAWKIWNEMKMSRAAPTLSIFNLLVVRAIVANPKPRDRKWINLGKEVANFGLWNPIFVVPFQSTGKDGQGGEYGSVSPHNAGGTSSSNRSPRNSTGTNTTEVDPIQRLLAANLHEKQVTDEFAFIPNAEESWLAILRALAARKDSDQFAAVLQSCLSRNQPPSPRIIEPIIKLYCANQQFRDALETFTQSPTLVGIDLSHSESISAWGVVVDAMSRMIQQLNKKRHRIPDARPDEQVEHILRVFWDYVDRLEAIRHSKPEMAHDAYMKWKYSQRYHGVALFAWISRVVKSTYPRSVWKKDPYLGVAVRQWMKVGYGGKPWQGQRVCIYSFDWRVWRQCFEARLAQFVKEGEERKVLCSTQYM